MGTVNRTFGRRRRSFTDMLGRYELRNAQHNKFWEIIPHPTMKGYYTRSWGRIGTVGQSGGKALSEHEAYNKILEQESEGYVQTVVHGSPTMTAAPKTAPVASPAVASAVTEALSQKPGRAQKPQTAGKVTRDKSFMDELAELYGK